MSDDKDRLRRAIKVQLYAVMEEKVGEVVELSADNDGLIHLQIWLKKLMVKQLAIHSWRSESAQRLSSV